MKNYFSDIRILLDYENKPNEATLIQNLIESGEFASFVYMIVGDLINDSYDPSPKQMQNVLDEMFDTLREVGAGMGSMDRNIKSIVEVVGEHSSILKDNTSLLEKANLDMIGNIDDRVVDNKPVRSEKPNDFEVVNEKVEVTAQNETPIIISIDDEDDDDYTDGEQEVTMDKDIASLFD